MLFIRYLRKALPVSINAEKSTPKNIFYLFNMEDNTNWTPSPDDNKLNITDKNLINEIEAKGIATAELFVFDLESETEITTQLILEIHRIAFGELYDWAGSWRTTNVTVGQLTPPEPNNVLQFNVSVR